MKNKELCDALMDYEFMRAFGHFRGQVRQALYEKGKYLNIAESDETIIRELRKMLGLKPTPKKVTKKDIREMQKTIDEVFEKERNKMYRR